MEPNHMPDTGVTTLATMAVRHHELYRTWIEAGFTEEQAFRLLLTVIGAVASMARWPNEQGSPQCR